MALVWPSQHGNKLFFEPIEASVDLARHWAHAIVATKSSNFQLQLQMQLQMVQLVTIVDLGAIDWSTQVQLTTETPTYQL